MVEAGGRRLRPLAFASLLPLLSVLVGAGMVVRNRVDRPPPLPAPPAVMEGRSGAAMAFDADTHQVVLFGGDAHHGSKLGDTWAWDGQRWRQLHPGVAPSARSHAAMAWDPAIHRLVLFGGFGQYTGTDSAGDTWAWDGGTWQELGSPLAGIDGEPALAYDQAHHQLLLVANTATEVHAQPSTPSPAPTPSRPGMPMWVAPTISWTMSLRTWSLTTGGWAEEITATVGGGLPEDPALGYDPLARHMVLLERNPAFPCTGAVGNTVAATTSATLVKAGSGPGAVPSAAPHPSSLGITVQPFGRPPPVYSPRPEAGCNFSSGPLPQKPGPRWWDGSAWRDGGYGGLAGPVDDAPVQDPWDGRLTVLQNDELNRPGLHRDSVY